MRDFIVQSLVASLVLTLLLNFVPRLFPKATRRAEQEVHRRVEDAWTEHEQEGSKVKVFFPWKAMIIISIVLTVVVNVASRLAP